MSLLGKGSLIGSRETAPREIRFRPLRTVGHFPLTLLVLGILTRVVTFLFLAPLDKDTGHLDVIKYIVRHHALPAATTNSQAYQPPLYYLLAAPLYGMTNSPKFVQAFSLILSVATLLVIYRLLYSEHLIAGDKERSYAFVLACFLPQFVQFSLYVSNDTLAVCLGALIILQAVRYAAVPNRWQLALLGLLVSAGMLTKATFLAFLPTLFLLVLFVRLRQGNSPVKALATSLAITLLFTGLGAYKFIRTYREVGDPFFSNLDLPYSWVARQRESYRGPASFLDFNVLKLLRSPSASPLTQGAYPLLLFGTFWYQHIPESNFVGSRHAPFFYLGSLIYVLAFIPTGAFLAGLFFLSKGMKSFFLSFDLSRREEQRLLVVYVAALFSLSNLALLLAATAKYHVWSIMQGRLLFPSFCGWLVTFGMGARLLTRYKTVTALLNLSVLALVVCFALYFTSEITYQAVLHSARHFGSATLGMAKIR